MSNEYKDWEQENKMERERVNKFLTEAMGECWHELSTFSELRDGYFTCNKCGKRMSWDKHTDFFTWGGFGKLISYLDGLWSDEEIAKVLYKLASDGCVTNLPAMLSRHVYDLLAV